MERYCYIGYWENWLTLSPHPDDEHVFISLGKLAATLVDNTLLVAPDPDGHVAEELDRDRNAGLGLKYKWKLDMRPNCARFMRHETEVEMSDDGELVWDIPVNHELPWPMLFRWPSIDMNAVAQREMYIRGRSIYEAEGEDGLKSLIRQMPDSFKSLLKGPTWSFTIQLIQQGKELPYV